MKIEDILLKVPFRRIMPSAIPDGVYSYSRGEAMAVPENDCQYEILSQSEFLREYFTSGHKVWNPAYYADRIKTDENGKHYVHYVERNAFPFQQIITTKQLIHLTGNPVSFINSNSNMLERQQELLIEFKQGWIKKNMEVAWYRCAKSEKITGDAAFCGYFDSSKKFRWRVFSFMEDDILYPHPDPVTGKMAIFGRKYKSYDESGKIIEKLDVWDNKYVTTYIKNSTGNVIQRIKSLFGNQDWSIFSGPVPHGFPCCPISYKRNFNGACWSPVQDACDKYELAVSQLSENNKAYAFRILLLTGDTVDINFDSYGQPTAIAGDKDADAKFLDKADASSSFNLQIDILLREIFRGSFTVIPPDVKSGDLPGVAIKLLYSPAVEKAMEDAKDWDGFMDSMVEIFKFGYSTELGKTAEYAAFDVRGEIIPYVHQNEAEIINNINASILAGSLSQLSGSEKHPYAASDEEKRLKNQAKEELRAAASIQDDVMNTNNQQREAVKV